MYLYGPSYIIGKKNLTKTEWNILRNFNIELQEHRKCIHVSYSPDIWKDYPTNPFARVFYKSINVSSECIKIILNALNATLKESCHDNGYDLHVLTGLHIDQLKEIILLIESQK